MEPAKPGRPILLRAIGNCVIETATARITPRQTIVFAAALFLILNRHRKVVRNAIEQVLWPSLHNCGRAHHRLRQTVLVLKEAGFPVHRENGFLVIAHPVTTDFDELLSPSQETPSIPIPNCFEVLPEFTPNLSVEYSHWLDERKSEIHANLVRFILKHIRIARNRGEWARVEDLTRMCGSIDPFNEEAILARAESVALRGGKVEALALLDEYVADLGTAPPELKLPADLMRRRISERRDEPFYDARETSLLGREKEMATLSSALESAEQGRGYCCIVEAPVGMGKSRLLSEFAAFAQLKGHVVRFSRPQPSDQSRPLSIVTELVSGLRKLRGAIGCAPESLECLDTLTASSSANVKPYHSSYGPSATENLFAAVLDLLDAVSEDKTILIIVDDAQWLDPPSLKLFETIFTWANGRKLLVVFAFRDSASEWPFVRKVKTAKVLRLSPLKNEQSTSLVEELAQQRGKTPTQEDAKRFVLLGEGNPFFLRELVGQWADSGNLENTPASLVAITNERLNMLSRSALRILQTCAILGRHSSVARLEQVLELRSFELIDGLNELGSRTLVRTERLPGDNTLDPRVVCAHELIGSAALHLLSPPAELAIHRRVGMVLEREIHDDYAPSLVAEAAHHWEKAGDTKHALGLTMSYAGHLMSIGVPTEAIHFYRKALTFCQFPSETLGATQSLITALYAAGRWQEVTEEIADLRNGLSAKDKSLFGHDEIELIGFEAKWRSSNQWNDLLEHVKKCIFADDAPIQHRVRAAVLGLKLATNVGTGEELDQIYSAIEADLENKLIEPDARLYVEMVYHIDRGDMGKGQDAASSLIEHERKSGNSANLIWSLVNAAQAMRRCGRRESARDYLEEAFTIAKQKNLPARACIVANHLVLTALSDDNLKKAREWLKIARSYPIPLEDLHTHHELLYYGARVALLEGDVNEALSLFNRILAQDDQSLLRRISLIALQLRLHVALHSSTDEVKPLVSKLGELFAIESARGGQDFEAFSLYQGMCYLGNQDYALGMLSEYVNNFRREKGPPPKEIQNVVWPYAKTGD